MAFLMRRGYIVDPLARKFFLMLLYGYILDAYYFLTSTLAGERPFLFGHAPSECYVCVEYHYGTLFSVMLETIEAGV